MADESLEQYYFKPEVEIIAGEIVPPITESHNFDYDNYPSVVDRYFGKHYYFRNDSIDEPHCILNHSNGICMVGLTDKHIAVKKGIKSITFDVGNFDRSKNKVSGKSKRGAMNLQQQSCLAIVTCNDDTTYRIVSGIQGKLVEVNERLLGQPELIGIAGDGYVAVVLPKLNHCQDQLDKLANEEEYQAKFKDNETECSTKSE